MVGVLSSEDSAGFVGWRSTIEVKVEGVKKEM